MMPSPAESDQAPVFDPPPSRADYDAIAVEGAPDPAAVAEDVGEGADGEQAKGPGDDTATGAEAAGGEEQARADTDDDQGGEEDEGGKKRRRPHRSSRRIARLHRENEALQARVEELERKISAPAGDPAPSGDGKPAAKSGPAPVLDDYSTDEEWALAYAAWDSGTAPAAPTTQDKPEKTPSPATAAADLNAPIPVDGNGRAVLPAEWDDYLDDHPGLEDRFFDPKTQITVPMANACMSMGEEGVALLHHLVEHPEDASSIQAARTPAELWRQIGVVQSRLSSNGASGTDTGGEKRGASASKGNSSRLPDVPDNPPNPPRGGRAAPASSTVDPLSDESTPMPDWWEKRTAKYEAGRG